MQAEVISVPTRGVERWLSQRLATALGASGGRADGVCANVDFPFPGTVVGGAVATATGVDRDADPWHPNRSVWPLLEVVDDCLQEPWLADLAAHLGAAGTDPHRQTRRFTSVRHIADLYDRYGVHRPQMVRSWVKGDDVDGDNRPLPETATWQAELWRRLAKRLDTQSPAQRLEQACATLQDNPEIVDLPRRLSMFGLTRLPASYLQVLHALAANRDVHLFLLHPSPKLWQRIDDEIGPRAGIMRRAVDQSAKLSINPLLTSWGRDAREMQLVLTAGGGTHEDHHHEAATEATTLLQRLQEAVRQDEAPAGLTLPGAEDTRPELESDDRSVQVHDCHGLARQVEVVRDVVLHLLADDPTLEARDIIVMCPDIETYAPLIHATFGAGDVGTADDDPANQPTSPDLRVRLADRSIRQTNPVLAVVSELLTLTDARLTAPQVLDLASRDPVRRRFRFNDDELARLKEWVAATGVRWGLDAAHRAPFKLQTVDANTWRAGLDRTLLGVAMADEDQRLFGGVLPLDDVESGTIDLAGRFAELLDRLQATLDSLRDPQPLTSWTAKLRAAATALTATTDRDSWQPAQLKRLLDHLDTESAASATSDITLALPEIRSLLADRLKGRPTRANFRTGHLTVCTLVPMRSVPHRIVILLGLDDGVFPRKTTRDGDDLTLDDPYVGDRDSRSEDRQLLLDALMAATDKLVITYAGRDERTNAERSPAVPLGELLDVIDRTVQTHDDKPARDRIVTRHPLQPFDVRNFTPGALLAGKPWSFDGVALDGARALAAEPHDRPKFLDGPLERLADDDIEIDDLVRFVQHPVKAFLKGRLGVSVGDYFEDVDQSLPVELDALEQWGVGDRLLDARLAGADQATCIAVERARGILPPGAFAAPILRKVGPDVDMLAAAAAQLAPAHGGARSIDVHIRLADGRGLIGTVAVVGAGLLRSVSYSKVAPKHRLTAWVRFLCLTAAHPDAGFTAATIGRAEARNASVTVARLPALDGDPEAIRSKALAHLAVLIDLYDRGMREPLPLYCKTSAAYATAIAAGRDPGKAVSAAWGPDYKFDKEDKDPAHILVLGEQFPYTELAAALPGPDECGTGWPADEPTRFGRYARRLWDPLIRHEELTDT